MKSAILLGLLLCSKFYLSLASREEKQGFVRRTDSSCDIHHAVVILQSLSAKGESFCTSLLRTCKDPTKTVYDTVTKTKSCTPKTITKTKHETFTTFTYTKTTTLKQLTKTEYASTVLIPSGNPRVVHKRTALPEPSTPAALSTCAPKSIATACSSLLARPTVTHTETSTHTEHACSKTITSTITTTDRTKTLSFGFTITPPPVIVSVTTAVLTTTVPADCAGPTYYPNFLPTPGDIDGFAQYPDQPVTLVECCVACYRTLNCVASEFDPDSDECGFLIRSVPRSLFGVSAMCPLGSQKFDFPLPPPGEVGDILPGPCGD